MRITTAAVKESLRTSRTSAILLGLSHEAYPTVYKNAAGQGRICWKTNRLKNMSWSFRSMRTVLIATLIAEDYDI